MPNRDAKRDIGAELLASVLEMKAGKTGRIHRIPTTLSYQDVIARGFTIDGTPDADVLTGTSANDTLTAFAGDDVVIAKAGADIVFGANVPLPIHKLTGESLWERTFEHESTEIV